MTPLVSVIIPTFNSSLWLRDTLHSVLRQTYPRERIELIVVDDASQDDTAAIARSFLRQHGLDGHLIASERNVGVGASRNIALKQGKGDWIQFVDHDDVLALTKIALQVEYAVRASADTAVVYSNW
jgi:teichuronic acid biosynthesis glycosyltransferase TuaG